MVSVLASPSTQRRRGDDALVGQPSFGRLLPPTPTRATAPPAWPGEFALDKPALQWGVSEAVSAQVDHLDWVKHPGEGKEAGVASFEPTVVGKATTP